MEVAAGVMLILGTLLLWIAAGLPISWRVYQPGAAPKQQISYVEAARGQWLASALLFGLGGLVAALGLLLLALSIQAAEIGVSAVTAAYLGAVFALIGEFFWLGVVRNRMTLSAKALFEEGKVDTWMFLVYTLCTQIALIALGATLLLGGYPQWLGLAVLIFAILSITLFIVFGDMPPFAHYIPLLAVGIVLVL